jgi:hypothetical protein
LNILGDKISRFLFANSRGMLTAKRMCFHIEKLGNPHAAGDFRHALPIKILTPVAEQLKKVVRSYQGSDKHQAKPGTLVGIYVALTQADPSPELIEQCKIIEEQHHIPVKPIAKDNLMRVTLRGLLKR